MSKGELMEELLRDYFLNSGYYVVKGVKYRYEGNDITDVDLYLYGRSSGLTRQRINVDVKNRKTPQAFERILWANGLRELLDFDSCIVATTDKRSVIHAFAQLHNTIVLDGAFLAKLRINSNFERIPEDELLQKLSGYRCYRTFNKDWRYIYEESKSRLLSEQDFAGFNANLIYMTYFLEEVVTDVQKREYATRMSYIVLSHLLIIIDYILKDIAFLETADRERKLSDGFKFGNLGQKGVDKIISMASKISGNKSANTFLKSLENIPTDILKDFFIKNENAKNLFLWAKDFEKTGFNKQFLNPNQLEPQLKGVLSVILDYTGIDRRKFFELFPRSIQTTIPLSESNVLKSDKELPSSPDNPERNMGPQER